MKPQIHKYASLQLFRALQQIKKADESGKDTLTVENGPYRMSQVRNTVAGLGAAGYTVMLDEEGESFQVYW